MEQKKTALAKIFTSPKLRLPLEAYERDYLTQQIQRNMGQMPNKSPEPTAVGAVSSAIAVHVTSRRWLSFFR
jgi:hypothetical protein